MYKLLILDDERFIENITWIEYPEDIDVDYVRNYKDFVAYVEKHINSTTLHNYIFSFDHDLQDFDQNKVEKTGYDCVVFLIDYLIKNKLNLPSLFAISHTQNVYDCKNIENYIEQHTKEKLTCCGCGHTGLDVYNDGYGFNICRTNNCTSLSVRGLSSSDFY